MNRSAPMLILRAILLACFVVSTTAGAMARLCPPAMEAGAGMAHHHHDEAPAGKAPASCDAHACCAVPTPMPGVAQGMARAERYAAYRLPADERAEALPPPSIERPPKARG